MMRLLRAVVRRATGPVGRRVLVLLLVAGLWAGWVYLPPRPLAEWTASDVTSGLVRSADGLTVACASSRRLPAPPPNPDPDRFPDPDRAFYVSPVRVFDVATGREQCRVPIEPWEVHGIQLSPDGRWLVIEDQNNRGSVWDATTGRLVVGPDAVPFGVPVMFLPDGRRCLLNGRFRGGDLKLWDLTAARPVATLESAGLPAVLTPDGRTLVSVGYEAVRFWDVATGRPASASPPLAAKIEDWCDDVAVAPNGSLLAVVVRRPVPPPADPQARVWHVLVFDLPAGTLAGTIPLPDQRDTRVWFSPDGRWLFVGRDPAPTIWDVTTRPLLNATPAALRRHPYRNSSLTGTPLWDNRTCVFGPAWAAVAVYADVPDTLDLIDLATQSCLTTFRVPADSADFAAIGSSPDGRLMAVQAYVDHPVAPHSLLEWIDRLLGNPTEMTAQGFVHLFDTSTGRARATFPTGGPGWGPAVVTFAPDSQTVWTIDSESDGVLTARRWTVPTGRPPWWLVVPTAVGVLLVVADWRRARRAAA